VTTNGPGFWVPRASRNRRFLAFTNPSGPFRDA
jgi:hypothetical protein